MGDEKEKKGEDEKESEEVGTDVGKAMIIRKPEPLYIRPEASKLIRATCTRVQRPKGP